MSSKVGLKLFYNSILNVSSYTLGLVLNFLLIPFIIDKVGIDYYGLYAVIIGLSAPLTLANLGFGEATIKFVAEYISKNNKSQAVHYVSNTLFLNLIVGVFGFIIISLFGTDIILLFNADITPSKIKVLDNCFLIAGFIWIFNQATSVFMGIPTAAQQYKYVALGNLMNSLLLPSISFLMITYNQSLLFLMYATMLNAVFLLLYWAFVSSKILGRNIFIPRYQKQIFKQSFHFGIWQTFSQVGGILTSQMEKFVVLRYLGDIKLGYYNSAVSLESKMMSVVYKLSEVLFPYFSSEVASTQEKKSNILVLSSWVVSFVSIVSLMSLIPLSMDFMNLWLGEKNGMLSYKILQYLLIAGTIGTVVSPCYFFLLGNGKTKETAIQSLVSGIFTIVSAIILLPMYGMRMAAMPIIIGASTQLILCTLILLRNKFERIYIYQFVKSTFLLIATGTICSLLLFRFKTHVSTSWVELALWYIVYAVIISIILILISILFNRNVTNIIFDKVRKTMLFAKSNIQRKK